MELQSESWQRLGPQHVKQRMSNNDSRSCTRNGFKRGEEDAESKEKKGEEGCEGEETG